MSAALVVCADAHERTTYSGWLRGAGFQVWEEASFPAAVDQSRRCSFSLTLADAAGAAAEATELAREVRIANPRGTLIFVGLEMHGRELATPGAEVLRKPVSKHTLLARVWALAPSVSSNGEAERSWVALRRRFDLSPIIGCSEGMLKATSLAARVAVSNATVLITGESGTGKELLARAIHANSPRACRPLVVVNCAAIPESLLESEMFGYRRGAFSGAHTDKPGLVAMADRGTLFLDEVSDMAVTLQPKLLRFLQDGSFYPLGSPQLQRADVRVIAATNASLSECMNRGTFRRDLYYRLSAFPIPIPPLRRRRTDILPLAEHFLRQRVGPRSPARRLSPDAVAYLCSHDWPGNVRELENSIARAVIMVDGELLTMADLMPWPDSDEVPGPDSHGQRLSREEMLDVPALNRALILSTFERQGRNVSAAARSLGLTRPTLRYRLRKYGVGV